ncbi:MAG: fibronectin type III domain-containing protein [Gemmatimonadaceae bacterium]|nr:fibronectin type III domain-containing protein [Chitinophagaceae bacterium]
MKKILDAMKTMLILILTTTVLVLGCKRSNDLGQSRLFRPVLAGQLSADSNTIVAEWQRIGGAKSYMVQLSRDTFRTVDLSMQMDTNVLVAKQLLYNQLYQVQVRANAPDSAFNSKWSYLGAVRTLSSILKNPAVDDITFNSVRVKWTTKGAPVTSVKILKTLDSSVAVQSALSPADRTNELIVMGGLQPAVKYTIMLYSGLDLRGYVDFNTKAPFSGTVIDLTGITGRPSVLADTIPIVPSGSTILLKKGLTYNIASAINLNKTLIIISAPDLSVTQQAKIYFTSNFNFAAGATIDSIEFNDVHMYSDNWASRYVFNTTNSATVGKLKFMNSRVEMFRGIVRLQSGTTTVNNFICFNSTLDSLMNYGVLTAGVATCKVDNFLLQNSTIYKAEKVIASSSVANSDTIESCTFNDAALGNGSYYIDYNANLVANGITVTNCIFGTGRNSAGAFAVRDFRAGAGTPVSAVNNLRTADHVSSGGDLPGISTYNRPSTQLWLDPANGNFQILDNTFPGRSTAGDPRWRL